MGNETPQRSKEWQRALSLHVQHLCLGELLEALLPQFSPDPRKPRTAKWHVRAQLAVRVYPHGSGFHGLRECPRTILVVRPDRAAEPEHRRVGPPHRVVRVGKPDHWYDGSELLFVNQLVAIGDVANDRGRNEVALVAPSSAAGDQTSGLLRGIDEGQHLFELLLVLHG